VSKRLVKPPPRTADQVRRIMLEYFFNRNQNATSRRGKSTGAAVTIKVLRAELKASDGLTAQEVHANLTYLLSHKWVEEQAIAKSFSTPRGGLVPAVTPYYAITAAGIDKIGGPSEFMNDRFHGIKIEAAGQNIITVGDGNQVEAKFRETGESLSELAEAIKTAVSLTEAQKLSLVADINSIQAQLAKAEPNKSVLRALWEGIQTAAKAAGLGTLVAKAASFLSHLF